LILILGKIKSRFVKLLFTKIIAYEPTHPAERKWISFDAFASVIIKAIA